MPMNLVLMPPSISRSDVRYKSKEFTIMKKLYDFSDFRCAFATAAFVCTVFSVLYNPGHDHVFRVLLKTSAALTLIGGLLSMAIYWREQALKGAGR